MTVLHQLYAMAVAAFIMLFAGSVVVDDQMMQSAYRTQLRQIVQRYLVAQVEHGAFSAVEPTALAETLLDSGPYRDITVTDHADKILGHRHRLVASTELPDWLLACYERPPLQLSITGTQIGSITAAFDRVSMATRAWDRSLVLLGWFCTTLVAALLLIRLILLRCLLPLQTVVLQADALSRRDYPIQHALPATPQLRNVVVALNRLSAALRNMVDAQMQAMNRLRDDAYRDRLTGLANRRFFELHLEQLLAATDEFDSGALILLSVRMPVATVDRIARVNGDALLVQTAAMIKEATRLDVGHDDFIARLSNTTFAISVTPASEREALAFAEHLAKGVQQLHQQIFGKEDDAGHVGVALYDRQNAVQWLAEAESALLIAQSKGPNAQHLYPVKSDRVAVRSTDHLADFLRAVIDQKNLILHLQPVLASANRLTLLQYEVLLRAVGENGVLLNAAHFVPTAKRLGLMPQIDRLVVTEVLSRLRQDRYGAIRIAVNLSPASLNDQAFVEWLYTALNEDSLVASKIAFEVVEIGVLDRIDAVRQIVDRVRQSGAQFGIDRVGRGFVSFDYLSSLTLDYLKIDGSFIRGIQDQRDNQLLLDSICKVAHGLDVIVIAESVETDEEWHCLGELMIDGVQGYGIGMPAEI